jgi:hypothetical protein
MLCLSYYKATHFLLLHHQDNTAFTVKLLKDTKHKKGTILRRKKIDYFLTFASSIEFTLGRYAKYLEGGTKMYVLFRDSSLNIIIHPLVTLAPIVVNEQYNPVVKFHKTPSGGT